MIEDTTYNFRGTIALVAANNLASQAIRGYKGLNSALTKCRFCMAIAETMSSTVIIVAVYYSMHIARGINMSHLDIC